MTEDEEYNYHTHTMGTSAQDNPHGQYSEPGSFNANYHDESHDELSELVLEATIQQWRVLDPSCRHPWPMASDLTLFTLHLQLIC